MEKDLSIKFYGPFLFGNGLEKNLFKNALSQKAGVYLWTIKYKDGYLIDYIGETGRTFFLRMKEHLIQCLGGNDRVCDPKTLPIGKNKIIWNGMWRKGTRDSMPDFIDKYVVLAPKIQQYVKLVKIFVAPIDAKQRILQRIESALYFELRNNKEPISTFQDDDIRYLPKRPNEKAFRVEISCAHKLHGIPTVIQV